MKNGTKVKMTSEAIENYGEKWRDVELVITHVAQSEAEHPGYDMGVYPQRLYDLKRTDTDESLGMSLYDWELEKSTSTSRAVIISDPANSEVSPTIEEDDDLFWVELIASDYEWTCPNCEVLNKTIEVVEQVACEKCGQTFPVNDYDHALA